ncbi:THO complex subunit 4A [Glycine soja]|uniref:THO complex subunit 4A n=1 Tax=Glycine soja TaxID=3848 RepID=A0A445M026_GLYSO|nr:THO complex subunit 4A [Glycine soja]
MYAAMDMSLDGIIKNNKKSGSGSSRGRTLPFGSRPTRRFPNRAANRTAPYATARASKVTWQHDLNANQHVAAAGYLAQGGRAASIETGTKLYISNLDYGVSNDDIKVLFGVVLYFFAFQHCYADANSTLVVNAASNNATARQIPNTFLGVFVEQKVGEITKKRKKPATRPIPNASLSVQLALSEPGYTSTKRGIKHKSWYSRSARVTETERAKREELTKREIQQNRVR